ncbi:hypothetical protein ACFQJC_10135 [Haloferax namakaokahaiae]|uniref:DUF385 domain-containing protein n=1 Tax=Haloferax namakaokahaiae TaxID=1748331 RepID=A0ABD5ZFF4_9EURY
MASAAASKSRVSETQRTLEQRVMNPFLRRVLQSPLHHVASRWTILVTYLGPKSGRRYTFPVAYERVGPSLVVVTPKAESNWWKNFRRPMNCFVWYRGHRRSVTGEVVEDERKRSLLRRYADGHRLAARELGIADGPVEDHPEIAVVQFSFS